MGQHLTGSVGNVHPSASWRVGARPGNKNSDQKVVISLLSQIPSSQGGLKDAALPQPGADGVCSSALADAIWGFQSFWKAKGTFKNIDGVVDPGGNTLRVLNTLVQGAEARSSGPNALPPANETNLNKLIGALRGIFIAPSRWTLTNAPGFSAGIDVGVGLGISGGQLDVREDGATQDRYLTYASGGVNMGWGPAGPVTFTASTRDMKSATSLKGLSGMGRIFSRQPNLTFNDMTGACCILGITGAAPTKFYTDVAEAAGITPPLMGASFNLFMLGMQPSGMEAVTRLAQVGHLHTGVMNAMRDVKAICMSAGEVVGYDLSAGISIGTATGYFGQITINPAVIDAQKKAKNTYDNAQKTVTNTVTDAAGNVIDNFSSFIKDWGRN